MAKFKQNGSVKDQQLGASGRPRSVCNPDNYDKVEASVDEDPRLSVRKRAQLNLKPFKIRKRRKLIKKTNPKDWRWPMHFARK